MIVPAPSPEPVTAIIGTILATLFGIIRGLGGGVKRAFEAVTRQIAYDGDVFRQNAANQSNVHLALWTHGLRDWLPGLIGAVRGIWDRVNRIVRPILQAIQRIKDTLDRLFNAYIAPILNLIQRLRKVLLILRVFHLKFAERLDRRLADLERKITEPFLLLRKKLNEVVNVINLVLHPDLYIRGNVIVRSIAEALAAIRGLLGFPRLSLSELELEQRQRTDREFFHLDRAAARQQQLLSGQLPPELAPIRERIRAEVALVRGTIVQQ